MKSTFAIVRFAAGLQVFARQAGAAEASVSSARRLDRLRLHTIFTKNAVFFTRTLCGMG